MQLYRHIRALIQDGILRNGTKLPSIRSLKRQLNISKTTIETAYHMLLEEGYVISRERSGMIVVNPLPAPTATGVPSLNSTAFDTSQPDANVRPDKKEPIDFSLLTIDRDSFPLRLWKSVIGESLSLNSQSIHQYGDVYGEYALRESLAQYLRRSRGVVCSPEQIVIGTGISYSVQLLSKLLGEHSCIGIEKPGIAQVRQTLPRTDSRSFRLPWRKMGGW